MNPDMSLPTASIDEAQRLIFKTSQDQDLAWELGVFYLKVPDWLDLEEARHFGRDILDSESPYRNIPQYGELEGFIALENNQ